MGNCLIQQNKMIIKVIEMNGEILVYKPPIKVKQELPQHANSDVLPVVRHLQLQPPVTSLKSVKNPKASVRIKLVVTKQELELMLKKGGVSMGDLVSRLGKNGSLIEMADGKWKHSLESIRESN